MTNEKMTSVSSEVGASTFDFSDLGDLSGQAVEADQQFDLHYGTAQDEYLISCIYLAKIHTLTAKAGRYGGGTWTKWYESKGLSKSSVWNMVQTGKSFNGSTIEQLKCLPELTRKDLNLIARNGCADQLVATAGNSQQVQDLLAQLKAKDDELAAEKSRAEDAETRLKNSCIAEQNAREAMQAAENARDAALADVNGLNEQNRQLRAENADLKKNQPITAVVDEEEVDRRAAEKAWGMAAARNSELQADKEELQQKNADLEQELAEVRATRSSDPVTDKEIADSCCVSIESTWAMAQSAFDRLVGTGESFNNSAHTLIRICDQIHATLVKMIIQNDKETLYE